MRTLIQKFQDSVLGNRSGSKEDAKQRLKFLLIHDQIDLTPGQLEKMKSEILDVISNYVDIDQDHVEFRLDRENGNVALHSNVPVRRVHGARA